MDDFLPGVVSEQYFLQILTAIKSTVPGSESTCGPVTFGPSALVRYMLLTALGITLPKYNSTMLVIML